MLIIMPRKKSKIPYAKERKVKRARKKFDKKIRKDKAANAFYAEELSADGEILAQKEKDTKELEEKIRLDVLKREKRKDELDKFAERKWSEEARDRLLESALTDEKAKKTLEQIEEAGVEAAKLQLLDEAKKKALEREQQVTTSSGDDED